MCVLEDLLAPPFELAVLCGWQATDERSILSSVALNTDWHVLEALIRLLVQSCHARGDTTSDDSVLRTEVLVSALLRSLL